MEQTVQPFVTTRRARRVGVEMMARCNHGAVRRSVVLQDMSTTGARITGLSAPQIGEAISLILPGQAARMAFVVWTRDQTSGVEFADPLRPETFDAMIRDYAVGVQLLPAMPAGLVPAERIAA